MKYNPEIHHRRSIRLKEYDYSQVGAYFLTICTWQKECLFGDVMNGEMRLNEFGGIVDTFWKQVPNHFPNVELDQFIIMPNHMHGLIFINDVGAIHELPLHHPTGQVRLQKAILQACLSGRQANRILFPPENLSNGHFVVQIVNDPHSSSLLSPDIAKIFVCNPHKNTIY